MPRANTGSTLPASGTTPSLGTERTADWPLAAPRSRRDMRMALGRGTWLEERLVSGRRRPGFSPGRTFPRALAPVVRGLTPLPTTGEPMDIGMVGLGRMGGNMALRLARGGHRVVGYDPGATARGAAPELETVESLQALVEALPAPRAVWLMVPAGAPVDSTLDLLLPLLQPRDGVVDGGNSNYRDSERRAARCRDAGVHFLDCGTSGGVWGLQEGYSLMVGGEAEAVALLRPVLETLAPAPDRGWGHVGPSGAGHFTKMVHNGIEYGMMQAYAEGFAIMQRKESMALDLAQVARIWQHGSVVRSWL